MYLLSRRLLILAEASLALCALVLSVGVARADTVGSDNTSNYSGNWTDGSNGYTGGMAFGAWSLSSSGGSNGGFFLGDSTVLAPNNAGANINSGGTSFAMYGHDNNGANAARSLTSALSIGQTFSFDMGVNYRNGYKGVNIYSGVGTTTPVFQFIVAGDAYTINNATTTTNNFGGYDANTAVHISFTQTSASGGSWEIDRSGGITSVSTGTYSGDITNFNFFVNQTSSNDSYGNADNFYFNNLVVAVPEPATWLGGLMVLGALGTQRKRVLAWVA